MVKKLFSLGVIAVLVFIGCFNILGKNTYAEQKKSVEEYTKLAGEYIKNNSKLLSTSIDALHKNVVYEDEVTKVDLLPISIDEINYRKGLRELTGIGDADYKSIFNTLVEEKLIISYAIRNNVLPKKNDIKNFIESEKNIYEQDEQVQKGINAFCTAANMSVEDYWNTFEYYNAFRVVTFKKAYDHAIESGINKGKLKVLDKYNNDPNIIRDIIKEHEDYWKSIKKDMKDNIFLEINKQYEGKGFTLDKSKLFL